jgi:Domain of unknown function (DUF4124)
MVLGSLVVFAAPAAVIYKWVDSDGVTHYSDQAVPGAEKIYTASSPATAASGPRSANLAGLPPPPKKPGSLNFTQFAITSPARDQTFFGEEIVGVNLLLAPELTANQTITWHLNGKELTDQAPDATHFVLQNLDRGAYALAATVTDQKTGESQSTDSISFFVRQPSALSPQHK